MKKSVEVLVLWADDFDPLVALSFVSAFRQLGLSVKMVDVGESDTIGKPGEYEPGEYWGAELSIRPKLGLDEAMKMEEQIACLVIPASSATLDQTQRDPLLWQLITSVHGKGGTIICGPSTDEADPALAVHLPPQSQIFVYPSVERLILFARWLARCLAKGERPHPNQSDDGMPRLIRVAGDSIPGGVAGAIAGIVRDNGFAETQSIGAAAANQMLKSAAIAKSYLQDNNLSLYLVPSFVNVKVNGNFQSAMRLFVSTWPSEMG